MIHKNSWFSVKNSRIWNFFYSTCSKLNKVHGNDNNSFSPKNAFRAIFPESATYVGRVLDCVFWTYGVIVIMNHVSRKCCKIMVKINIYYKTVSVLYLNMFRSKCMVISFGFASYVTKQLREPCIFQSTLVAIFIYANHCQGHIWRSKVCSVVSLISVYFCHILQGKYTSLSRETSFKFVSAYEHAHLSIWDNYFFHFILVQSRWWGIHHIMW